MAIKTVIFKGLTAIGYAYTAMGGIRFYDGAGKMITLGSIISESITEGEFTNAVVTATNSYNNSYTPVDAFNTNISQTQNYPDGYWLSSYDNQALTIEFKTAVTGISKIEFNVTPDTFYTDRAVDNPFTIEIYNENKMLIKSYSVIPNTSGRNNINKLNTPELIWKYLFKDGVDIKKYDSLTSSWVIVGPAPATESMFITDGMDNLNSIVTPDSSGIKPIFHLNNPILLVYSQTVQQLKSNLNIVAEKRTRFLVSKDGCLTWYAFKDGIWKQVALTDINDKGMSKTELQAITSDQWKQWFTRGTLDFAVSLKTTNPYSSPTLNKITVNFPVNQAPLIQNPSLTPDTIHNEWVELRATVEDLEGDQFQYQVWINGSQVYPTTAGEWSPLLNSGESIFKAYNYPYFRVGTNVVKLIVRDKRGLTREWSSNVTVTNINPTITISHGNFSLVGTIGDDNSDSVAYRILINGRQVFPTEGNNIIDGILYSDFAPSPRQIKYEWGSNDVRFGVPNTFTIEVIDNFKGKGLAEFQVVGTYKGILFMDEQGNFYSTDKGEILKYLDFGTLIAGQETEPKLVYLKNQNGFDVENVELKVTDNLPPGVNVYISKSNQPFEYNMVINHSGVLQDEETIPFYVKLVTDKMAEAGVSFEITTKASPVT
ncbi:hypothetical protein E308F_30680 [Moorella sp. E308F]|uniref:hypothetical protein n=1 Tax=Moorella sp. E308F TaxID=2572682 RepID=UPI0010FFB4E6|nr:hypothetical protein [Moorella sp. E308F]GEA16822.1 hypothetical protein E308F_30680 [Moorella sp. E308F]